MRKSLVSICLSVVVATSFAQQDPQFTQNMFNKLLTNPGYAGTNKGICGTIIYRNQWTSFDGAPKTGLISVDAYLPKIKGGLGLTLMNDQLGFEKGNYAKLAYSFHLPVGAGTLGIGAEAGLLSKSINGKWIAPDGTSGSTDLSIPVNQSKSTYDLGAGLFYSSQNFWAGLSSTHLIEQELTDLHYTVARTYYLTAGATFPLNTTWELKPSVFAKSVGSPTQIDINCIAQWNSKFYGGISARLVDAWVCPLFGYNHTLSNGHSLRVGYSYDLTTSSLRVASKGSHEILVNYCLTIEPPTKKSYHENIRFSNN